jgi:glutaredoxin-related protein
MLIFNIPSWLRNLHVHTCIRFYWVRIEQVVKNLKKFKKKKRKKKRIDEVMKFHVISMKTILLEFC